jgi:hypothetical protein
MLLGRSAYRRGSTLLALDMALEGSLGYEYVEAAGATRCDPSAAPPAMAAQRVRLRVLAADAQLTRRTLGA